MDIRSSFGTGARKANRTVFYQLTYISTPRLALVVADVEKILQISRRNNQIAKVTGLLVFDSKRFLQVLEGPVEAVKATFARIACDVRHRAVMKLSSQHVPVREFGCWSMGTHLTGQIMDDENLLDHVDAMNDCLAQPHMGEKRRGLARIRMGSSG